MAAYTRVQVIAYITAQIVENTTGAITAAKLNQVLDYMVDRIYNPSEIPVSKAGYSSTELDSLIDELITNINATPDELTDLDTTVTGAELDAIKAKIDLIEAQATADQTGTEIKDLLEALTGAAQLDSTKIWHAQTSVSAGQAIDGVQSQLNSHESDETNPHSVTASQVISSDGDVQGDIDDLQSGKADKSNVIEKDNTTPFTPDSDYEPATKKYVDDAVIEAGAGDMTKSVYDPSGINSNTFDVDNHTNGTSNKVYTTAEKNKLATIESGATADQTGLEIKTAYELQENTNAFTDAEKTKLASQSGVNTGDQDISALALKSNVIEKNSTTAYTPTLDYHPANKKYVDLNAGAEFIERPPLNPVLYNSVEGDFNTATTPITINELSLSGGSGYIVVNYIPVVDSLTRPVAEKKWLLIKGENASGDSRFILIDSVDYKTRTLYVSGEDYTGSSVASFTVGDKVGFFNPYFANGADYMDGDLSGPMFTTSDLTFATSQIQIGGVIKHSTNGKYYALINGNDSGSDYRIGVAESTDLKNWSENTGLGIIIGSGDDSSWDKTTNSVAIASVIKKIGTENTYIGYVHSEHGDGVYRIYAFEFDEDFTTINPISENILEPSDSSNPPIGYLTPSVVYYKDKYHMAVSRQESDSENYYTEVWTSSYPTNGFAKAYDIGSTSFHSTNNFSPYSHHIDGTALFLFKEKLWGFVRGTPSKTSIEPYGMCNGSGLFSLVRFDDKADEWVFDTATAVLAGVYNSNPYNINIYLNGHVGGNLTTIYDERNNMWLFYTMSYSGNYRPVFTKIQAAKLLGQITEADFSDSLKTSRAIEGVNVDFSSAAIFTKTLTENTTLTFSNYDKSLNQVKTLLISGAFNLTFPAQVNIIRGTYSTTEMNYIQIHCTDSNTPVFWGTIDHEI
jgi:hypothetical protein